MMNPPGTLFQVREQVDAMECIRLLLLGIDVNARGTVVALYILPINCSPTAAEIAVGHM